MMVSVVIRTKNEEAAIGKTLRLIDCQTLRPHDIVVVDSGSTDQTVQILKSRPDVNLIEMPGESFTYGKSLNTGFEAARGDIVVSLSAHAFPLDKYWLENLIRPFRNGRVAGIYGKQLPHPDAWPPVRRDYRSYYPEKARIQYRANDPADYRFSNANAAIRRRVWEQQPFHETLSYAEDQEWARNILRLGHEIIYEPRASVYHSHNESLIRIYQRSYKEHLAYRELYGSDSSLLRSAITWLHLVKDDAGFIFQSKRHLQWLVFSPVYRLFYILGRLRAYNLP